MLASRIFSSCGAVFLSTGERDQIAGVSAGEAVWRAGVPGTGASLSAVFALIAFHASVSSQTAVLRWC